MSDGSVGGVRRSPPVVAADRSVARSRLVSQLAERFTKRVVTLVAHAGCGKTTTLALAMEANRIDPWGTDVWLALDRRDDDPDRLLTAVSDVLGTTGAGGSRLDAITDAVWSMAPDEVALILDDVHVIRSQAALEALGQLVRELPANGHLVLASRTDLSLPLARLRAQFDVLELDADDLSFDDDELRELLELRGGRTPGGSMPGDVPAELPRVAALADLTIRFGTRAGTDYLWEEVLDAFATPDLDALRRLALIGVVAEPVAQAIVESTGATLDLDALALVGRDESGRLELHDLLRAALLDPLSESELAELASAAAADAERAGDRALAVVLHVDAGDEARAEELARAFIMTATLRRTYDQIKRVSRAIDRVDPDSPLARFLRAELRSGHGHTAASTASQAVEFGDVARAAELAGDDAVEAAASYRCHQQSLLELRPTARDRLDRLAELAPRLPYAAQVLRFARASRHLRRGDSAGAWAEIVDLDELADPESEQVFRTGLMCLLGRFDDAVAEFAAGDPANPPPGIGEYVAYAFYLGGFETPEQAASTFEEYSQRLGRAELAQTSVVLLTTGCLISLHVGDDDRAADYLNEARRVVAAGCAPSFAVNADTAAAALALATEDEAAARAVLVESFARVPLGRWPNAAHLTVLPLLYLLFPELRDRLDACDFGRPTTVAREVGRALVAAREQGDATPSLDIPWEQPSLLRVQVLPPLLAELAAVAVTAGSEPAAEILDAIPHADRWLRRCARESHGSAEAANVVLAGRPQVPERPLRITTLGPLTVERGGEVVEHPDLVRRARVQQLLGLLAERRTVTRRDAAELLWPDLEPKSASHNLRVTLAYLNRALEPDRDPEEPPVYVTQIGDHIGLHPEVTTDLDAFRSAVRAGMSHTRRRTPRSAMVAYREAAELYRGEFLAGHDDDWIAVPREQTTFDALHTLVRLGELSLARGEPEDAAWWASRARSFGPRHERAERLLAGCQLATGDRAGAVRTLRALIEELRLDGVEPEHETLRTFDRLTV